MMSVPSAAELWYAAGAHSTAEDLIRCPRVEPLPRQTWLFWDAAARAAAAGLRLPRRLSVTFVDRPRDSHMVRGATWHTSAGVVAIYLDANLRPHELPLTAYHELRHAHQFASGFVMTVLQREADADAFAAQMMGRSA